MENTALMVIDVQIGLFEEAPVYQAQVFLQNLNVLIDRARTANIPIVFVQHCEGEESSLYPEKPSWGLHPDLHPADGDIFIRKTKPSSFHETTLESELQSRGIQRLVISGMQTEYCVDATSRAAAERGYDVTVVQDAHSTFDSPEMPAAEIIAERNKAFVDDKIARLVNTDDVTFKA